MSVYIHKPNKQSNELYHHGIKGQKWGVRRYQRPDGTLTPLGKKRLDTVHDSTVSFRDNVHWQSEHEGRKVSAKQYERKLRKAKKVYQKIDRPESERMIKSIDETLAKKPTKQQQKMLDFFEKNVLDPKSPMNINNMYNQDQQNAYGDLKAIRRKMMNQMTPETARRIQAAQLDYENEVQRGQDYINKVANNTYDVRVSRMFTKE